MHKTRSLPLVIRHMLPYAATVMAAYAATVFEAEYSRSKGDWRKHTGKSYIAGAGSKQERTRPSQLGASKCNGGMDLGLYDVCYRLQPTAYL